MWAHDRELKNRPVHYSGKASTFPLQYCIVASPIRLKFFLLVNFIKIAAPLRVGSIQVKNISLLGVPLLPVQFSKFFLQDIFSSIHTSCVNFIRIAPLLRVVSIQAKNIGLWGVPLPLPILKIFRPGYFLVHTHILCEFH